MAEELKYRSGLSTTVDMGLYKAIYYFSVDTNITLSRLMDEAIEDFLIKRNVPYVVEFPYRREGN